MAEGKRKQVPVMVFVRAWEKVAAAINSGTMDGKIAERVVEELATLGYTVEATTVTQRATQLRNPKPNKAGVTPPAIALTKAKARGGGGGVNRAANAAAEVAAELEAIKAAAAAALTPEASESVEVEGEAEAEAPELVGAES